MAFFSTYAETKLVDALYRAQALGAPATLYASLQMERRQHRFFVRCLVGGKPDAVVVRRQPFQEGKRRWRESGETSHGPAR